VTVTGSFWGAAGDNIMSFLLSIADERRDAPQRVGGQAVEVALNGMSYGFASGWPEPGQSPPLTRRRFPDRGKGGGSVTRVGFLERPILVVAQVQGVPAGDVESPSQLAPNGTARASTLSPVTVPTGAKVKTNMSSGSLRKRSTTA